MNSQKMKTRRKQRKEQKQSSRKKILENLPAEVINLDDSEEQQSNFQRSLNEQYIQKQDSKGNIIQVEVQRTGLKQKQNQYIEEYMYGKPQIEILPEDSNLHRSDIQQQNQIMKEAQKVTIPDLLSMSQQQIMDYIKGVMFFYSETSEEENNDTKKLVVVDLNTLDSSNTV